MNGGSSSTLPRAYDHDLDGAASLPPPPDFGNGTPMPLTAVPAELADLESGPADRPTPYEPYAFDDSESMDADLADLTEPVDLEQLEPAIDPVRIIEIEAEDVGVRTLMGVGARAVRAVATAGWVDSRAARRGLSPTPGQSSPQEPTTPLDAEPSGPPAVIISSQIWKGGSFPVAAAPAPAVQPSSQSQEPLVYPVLSRAAVEAVAPMAARSGAAAAPSEPGPELPWPAAALAAEPRAPRPLGRVLVIVGLALALVGIGVSIGMAGI